MKSALLAQNDDLAIENLKKKVGRSVFDLSHSTTFPIDVDGAILPICCLETVPSDSFEISCECLLRQLTPLQVPLMANFRLNTAWFWCDNRLGWKKWDRFMTGGRSGNEVYELPRMFNNECYPEDSNSSDDAIKCVCDKRLSSDDSEYCSIDKYLHTYFGYSQNVTSKVKIYDGVEKERFDNLSNENDLPLAFPFFDYQIICRDFYTNVDRLAQQRSGGSYGSNKNPLGDWCYENLFPVDDDEFKLVDGIQDVCGFHSGDDPEHSETFYGCYLDKVRYHNVREDYFTSSKKAPMRGDEPAIEAANGTFTLPSGTSITLTNTNGVLETNNVRDNKTLPLNTSLVSGGTRKVFPMKTDSTTFENYKYRVYVDDPDNFGIAGNVDTDLTTVQKVEGSTTNDLTVTGEFSMDLTAREIRLLGQLSIWKELNMLHEPYYNDFLNAHFDGVSVGESALEKPQYIGGTSQRISINEIIQTSQTSDTSPLGNQGAVAMSLASNYVGKYYCNNYGYLIGVAYIITDMYYNPAIPRWSSRRTKEDYYSPEFANLSMQAILNKEIFASSSNEWNNTPWGYTGAFDELRSIPNKVAGDLLNDDYKDLESWVIKRDFTNDNKPSMSSEFLSLNGNVNKSNIFSVPSMPAFMLQCANYIKAVRPMPKVAIPKAL